MTSFDQWFAAEVLPYEAMLVRYLRRVWPNAADIPDLRQEVMLRVYQASKKTRPAVPKLLLLTTARNLLTDKVRHERIVSIDFTQDFAVLDVLTDEMSPERRLNARQELTRLSDALDGLSDDCRAVIWLRRVEGLSQREAAQRLKMNEGTLESHMCRGIKALMRMMFDDEPEDEAKRRSGGRRERSQS
jgi:RNA polymerase sigma factor (sigma-70 family)